MGILEWVFGGETGRKVPPKDDALARAIVDRVVDATDKRLRQVSAYQKRLREAALVTLEHVRNLALALPGPVEVSARAWRENLAIRPFFVRAEDVPAAFSRAMEVRRFFESRSAAQCLALLGCEHAEKQVFATALAGDTIQREVARTTVNFGPPRILLPGAEETPVRIEIAKAAVDYLGLQALARITALQDEKRELEGERALLKTRLQLAERAHRGLAEMTSAGGKADPAEIARALEENQHALAGYAATGLMARFLDELNAVLSKPGEFIRVEPLAVTVDAMNFKVAEGAPDAATTLNLQLLKLADGRTFAAMLAEFPRSELLPAEQALADLEKYL